MNILIGVPLNSALFPATGPAYVASSLKAAGHAVRGWSGNGDLNNGLSWCDVFMAGGLACHYRWLKTAVGKARKKGIPTVVGGGIVSAEPELMTHALECDYSVLGQGEETAVDLLRHLDSPERVPGVGFMRDGVFIETPARAEIKDLDAVPFPDHEAFGYRERLDRARPSDRDTLNWTDHPREYCLVASRSCPYHCTFCYHTSGYRYRRRSLDSVFAELDWAIPRYRINQVFLLDELFSEDKPRMLEFCQKFERLRRQLGWEIRWACAMRADSVDAEMLDAAKHSGCHIIGYGFESYSAAVLDSMRKRISPQDIERAIRLSLERGIFPQGNFIFGDRSETLDTAEKTLSFWRKHKDAGIELGAIVVCPGSPDYHYCVERNLIPDRLRHVTHNLFRPLNMTTMSEADFARLQIRIMKANSLEIVWVGPMFYEADRLSVECPFCFSTLRYENYRLGWFQKSRVVCRRCNRRFFVSYDWRRWPQKFLAWIAPERPIVFRIAYFLRIFPLKFLK